MYVLRTGCCWLVLLQRQVGDTEQQVQTVQITDHTDHTDYSDYTNYLGTYTDYSDYTHYKLHRYRSTDDGVQTTNIQASLLTVTGLQATAHLHVRRSSVPGLLFLQRLPPPSAAQRPTARLHFS
jgi:hypothetical protein